MAIRTKFVIHDHTAKKAGHHFDFRIEYQGKLKSWAIPKARLPEKGQYLLAIQTPDHPLSYYNFEGEIKDGYGQGNVTIFDKGVCDILRWKKDQIGFILKGKKVQGKFWLIRTNKKSWLLLRGK